MTINFILAQKPSLYEIIKPEKSLGGPIISQATVLSAMASEITPDNKNKEIAEPMVIENSAVLNFANPFGSNRNSNKKSNSDNYFAMPATGWN